MAQQQGSVPEVTGASGRTDGVRISSGAIVALGSAGLLLVFMLQNRESLTLHFLVWSFTWPVWLFVLLDAVLGALVWLGFGVVRRHRRRKARREDRRD
jgi:uncharacterized integral membrane protein